MELLVAILLQMYNRIIQYQQHLLQQPGIALPEKQTVQQIIIRAQQMKVLHALHVVSHGIQQHPHVVDVHAAQQILMNAVVQLLNHVLHGYTLMERGLLGELVWSVSKIDIGHILQLEPVLELMLIAVLIQEL